MINKKILEEDNRLILRYLDYFDLYDMFDILKDEETTAKAMLKCHRRIEDTIDYMDFLFEDTISLGIELRDEQKLIGYISFMEYDEDINGGIGFLSPYYIGYIVNKNYQNRGYGMDAIRMAIDLAFSYFGMDLLICEYIEDNEASEKITDRLGFRYKKNISIKGPDKLVRKGIRKFLFKK